MRSALAARMYAAVQLSSQQQQMYVENNIKKKEQNEFITYQRFIRKVFFFLSRCAFNGRFFFILHIREKLLRRNSLIVGRCVDAYYT